MGRVILLVCQVGSRGWLSVCTTEPRSGLLASVQGSCVLLRGACCGQQQVDPCLMTLAQALAPHITPMTLAEILSLPITAMTPSPSSVSALHPRSDPASQRLTVRVLDADVGKSDDLLGTAMRGLKVNEQLWLCLLGRAAGLWHSRRC